MFPAFQDEYSDSDEPAMANLDLHSVKVYFKDYQQVYFREPLVQQKRPTCVSAQSSFDTRHECFYCCKIIFGNIFDHLRKIHKVEKEILEIKDLETIAGDSLPLQKNKIFNRQRLLGIMRNRGDHKHNTRVIISGAGELFLSRKPTGHGPHYVGDYSPCPDCFAWVLDLPKHRLYQEHCPSFNDKRTTRKDICRMARARKALTVDNAQNTCDNGENQSDDTIVNDMKPFSVPSLTIVEVFSKMKSDEVTRIVRTDVLIHAVGINGLNNTINPHSTGKSRITLRNTISLRMRLCAKVLRRCRQLLQEAKEEFKSDSYWVDMIMPALFDTIATGVVHECCGTSLLFDKPERAIKFGSCLAQMCTAKLNMALVDQRDQDAKDARALLTLVDVRWHEAVRTKSDAMARGEACVPVIGTSLNTSNPNVLPNTSGNGGSDTLDDSTTIITTTNTHQLDPPQSINITAFTDHSK